MRVMVLVKATADSEAGAMPSSDLLEAMGRYNELLVEAGVMKGGDGLQPSSKGKRVAFDGDKRAVIDGPFAETKEIVAGYWLWEVKDMDEAVAWARRIPDTDKLHGEVEIRPIVSMEDFEAFTPEIQAREEALREQIGSYGSA